MNYGSNIKLGDKNLFKHYMTFTDKLLYNIHKLVKGHPPNRSHFYVTIDKRYNSIYIGGVTPAFAAHIAPSIEHEVTHLVIMREISKKASKQFDNIANLIYGWGVRE